MTIACPIADRLEEDEVLSSAVAVRETEATLSDPRLAEALVVATYSGISPRVLFQWPDGALGFAWFPQGASSFDAIKSAYATARSSLEALHLELYVPASATTWTN